MTKALRNFTQVPNFLIRTSLFSPAEKAILLYLCSLKSASPSRLSIRRAIGLGNSATEATIKSLRRDRVLSSKGYVLLPRHLWQTAAREQRQADREQRLDARAQRDNTRRDQHRERSNAPEGPLRDPEGLSSDDPEAVH